MAATRDIDWPGIRVNIDEEYLHHLRFAKDIVLISDNIAHLQDMILDLYNHSMRVGQSTVSKQN